MTNNDPNLISVIIPCRCNANELKKCIQGIKIQEIPHEVIVLDSTSNDSVANVTSQFDNVHLVPCSPDLLPGGARNLGTRYARSEYLLFIDADCIPESGWIMSAISALKAGAKIASGPILDKFPFHPVAFVDNLLQFADFPLNRPNGISSYFPGCNLALTRTVFIELGGFPDDLPAGEDVIFSSLAAKRWPLGLWFVHTMRVHHSGRKKFDAFMKHQEVFGFYRGRLGLKLRPIYQHLGEKMIMAIPIIYIRFFYIISRTARWNKPGLLRIIVFLPILLFGLAAWAKGFHRGCSKRRTE